MSSARKRKPPILMAKGYAPPPRPPVARPRRRTISIAVLVGLASFFAFGGLSLGWFVFQGPGAAFMRRLNVEVPAELRERPVVVAKVALPVAMIEQPKQVPTEKAVDPPKPIESPKAVDKPKPQAPPLSSPASVAVSFDRQIRPIFEAKCNNCHGLKKPKGDLDLRTLAALNKGGTSGPAVKPGDPTMSTLWESVETDRMPPGKAKLTTSERDLVKRWIESGAK